MTHARLVSGALAGLTFVLAACAPKFTQTVTYSQVDGWANDGDPAQPRATYNSLQGTFTAFDGISKGRSSTPTWERVEGETHAILGANSDGANSASNNKVKSQFKVDRAAQVTFDVEVTVFGLTTTGNGKQRIEAAVTIFDAQGVIVPDAAGRPNKNLVLDISNDPNGNVAVTPGGIAGAGQAGPAVNAGRATMPFTAGDGVRLAAGTYEIQLELIMQATAPDAQSSVLASASATIRKN
jgi:hypothetical protein